MEKIKTFKILKTFIVLGILFSFLRLSSFATNSVNTQNQLTSFLSPETNYDFRFAVVQYKGGDWYQGKVGVKNLLNFINQYKLIKCFPKPLVVTLEDVNLARYPFLYLTGHGQIKLSQTERNQLYLYLLAGGFLYVNDDYGLAESFEKEIAEIFPNQKWQDIPLDHSLFRIYHFFPKGTPKIHEHKGGAPITKVLTYNERIIILYTKNTDIGDGWADYRVHKNNQAVRTQAFKFGMNVILYALLQ